jgi:hypothetical protein
LILHLAGEQSRPAVARAVEPDVADQAAASGDGAVAAKSDTAK